MSSVSLPELTVGERAPDFTLPSTSGSDVTLSSFRGRSNVLVAFFPLAFTGTCTAEMCDLTTDFSKFEQVDATVLGISVDSIPTLKEFRAKNEITIDLLSDFKRDVSRRYGVLLEDHFFATRAYFVIDKDGKVRWMHVEENPGEKRDNAELLAALSQI